MEVVLARHAMATRFEIVLHGPDERALRAAGEAALEEIDRLESQLSLYRPTSEIAAINSVAGHRDVHVSPETFALLQRAVQISDESAGAFDITVAPLVRCWGFMGGTGRMPSLAEIESARACVGAHLMELDERERTIRFLHPGVMIDLGAIGKGYAVEKAAEALIECGVENALLHGGTSTVLGMGNPPDQDAWPVAIDSPLADGTTRPVAIARLRNQALSVSGSRGKCFAAKGNVLGHVIDPRTGEPCNRALIAVVVADSATDTDALSTALLVEGIQAQDKIQSLRSGMRTLVGWDEAGKLRVQNRGIT